MREYSKEEIDTLWKNAYIRAITGQVNIRNVWILVLLLLFPVGLFGFPATLLLVWFFISVVSIVFAIHVRTIWQSSEAGSFPASTAIVRMLINSSLGPLLIFLFCALMPFGMAYLEDPNGDYLPIAVISIIVYIATIPLANLWAKRQTQLIIEKDTHIISNGLQVFSGWMRFFFWISAIFLGIMTILFTPDISDIRFLSGLFPGFAIFILILSFGNIRLVLTISKFRSENGPYQSSIKEFNKWIREDSSTKQQGPIRIPVWCEGCNAQGEIEVDDSEGNYFVICEVCGTETAEVWCEDEEVGGQFVPDIHEHPTEYICRFCKKTHQLPTDFYEKPVTLELIEEPRNKKK